jgi:hypothetical protein
MTVRSNILGARACSSEIRLPWRRRKKNQTPRSEAEPRQYLTEHPYGRVEATAIRRPAAMASNASRT